MKNSHIIYPWILKVDNLFIYFFIQNSYITCLGKSQTTLFVFLFKKLGENDKKGNSFVT